MVLGLIRKIFRKEKTEVSTDLPAPEKIKEEVSKSETQNLRARIDLLVTQIESLRVQYESLNTKIGEIEKMLRELYQMAKSS
jgi:predicted transcriptional regulator